MNKEDLIEKIKELALRWKERNSYDPFSSTKLKSPEAQAEDYAINSCGEELLGLVSEFEIVEKFTQKITAQVVDPKTDRVGLGYNPLSAEEMFLVEKKDES